MKWNKNQKRANTKRIVGRESTQSCALFRDGSQTGKRGSPHSETQLINKIPGKKSPELRPILIFTLDRDRAEIRYAGKCPLYLLGYGKPSRSQRSLYSRRVCIKELGLGDSTSRTTGAESTPDYQTPVETFVLSRTYNVSRINRVRDPLVFPSKNYIGVTKSLQVVNRMFKKCTLFIYAMKKRSILGDVWAKK